MGHTHALMLQAAMASSLYNVHAKHTSNSGFDRTFMPCSGYFYALPNNEQSTKYRGLTSSAKQIFYKSVGLPIARGKLVYEFNFHLTVSITVVRSIETPPNHPKPPPNHPKPLPYILAISYNAQNILLGHSRPLRGGRGHVPPPP